MTEENELAISPNAHVVAQFQTDTGETTGPQLDLPIGTTTSQLEILINHLLNNVSVTAQCN
jgi:hypothetical protein